MVGAECAVARECGGQVSAVYSISTGMQLVQSVSVSL